MFQPVFMCFSPYLRLGAGGGGCREVPATGWQQGREQPAAHGTAHAVQRCEILVRGGQAGGTGGGARHGHPGAPPDRGRSNTDTQNAGATPRGTRASTADKEEGHSKAGEATRTAGTGNQNGADGGACAWEAAAIKRMAWPASPSLPGARATSAQPASASGGGCLPQPRWAVCATGAGAHQGQTSREGEKDIWWTARTARGGTGNRGQRCVDSKNSQTTPATTSTSSIRQLLGAADAQTAHHATSSTAPTHQPLGSANAETTPQEHRPRRLTESSDSTQHAKGRTGDHPGPRKGATTRRNVTQGVKRDWYTTCFGSFSAYTVQKSKFSKLFFLMR